MASSDAARVGGMAAMMEERRGISRALKRLPERLRATFLVEFLTLRAQRFDGFTRVEERQQKVPRDVHELKLPPASLACVQSPKIDTPCRREMRL